MNLRTRFLIATDRLLGAVLIALLAGTTAAFGGRVWWGPLAIGSLSLGLVGLCLIRILLQEEFKVLKSPLAAIGSMALALALVQLAPLPAALSGRLSPASRSVYAMGFLTGREQAFDANVELPPELGNRSPISVDRPATLRWLAGASACLAVFWGVSQYTDRLGHLYLVWGSVVAGFFLNTAVAAVQLVTRSRGVYGFIEPGKGPAWAPTLNDLLDSPGSSVFRAVVDTKPGHPALAMAVPDLPHFVGSQMGGAGAYLALGSVGLPLGLALALQLLAPRGSREPMTVRLRQSGQGSLVSLVYGMVLASALIAGLLAGPLYCAVFAVALVVVGLPAASPTGLRWGAVGLTVLALGFLVSGTVIGTVWADLTTSVIPFMPADSEQASRVWSDAAPIVKDFPLLGSGMGTFASVYSYYKSQDTSVSNAMSSLLQWWVETGFVGMALVGLASLWCLWRLPGAVRGVGTADRSLAFGLIGAAFGFTLMSALHWTIELFSVALAASAVGGTANRWLSGGTDLFVERG